MDEAGVYMDYVPAEAHNKIGLIERRNATYRSLMERVIEHQAVVGSDQMELATKRSSTETEQPIPEQAPRASADFAALLTKHIRQQRIGNNTYLLHGYQNIAKAANTTGTGLHVWARLDTA